MAVPLTVGAAAIRHRGRLPDALVALLGLLAVLLVLLIGVFGAIFGLQPAQTGYGPSAAAQAQIPAVYLRLYVEAGRRYRIDPWIPAGIGAVETDHGRSTAPGVRSGVNAFGCCAGPMQFSTAGKASTWDRYGVDRALALVEAAERASAALIRRSERPGERRPPPATDPSSVS